MSLSREEAHELVNRIYDVDEATKTFSPEATTDIGNLDAPEQVLPEGKRVVRTKGSGDRVYLLDDIKKTRQWVTNPEVLDSLDFTLNDVTEVEEDEMLRYQMGPALYRRVDEA